MKGLAAVLSLVVCCVQVRAEERTDLTGPWSFALDPGARGESLGWHEPPDEWKADKPLDASGGWEPVEVPHCWSVDPRYDYTGKAWYRRSFKLAKHDPANRYRLEFDAAFYRARIWINGKRAGEHEGGYTPFALDVTPHLRPDQYNLIAVEVDNSWSLETLPGARPGTQPARQLYPWWNYGGITRPARIVAHPAVHVINQKVEAIPDLASGAASITIRASVTNAGDHRTAAHVQARITDIAGQLVAEIPAVDVDLAAGETKPTLIKGTLERAQLWRLDAPRLYTSIVEVIGAKGATSTRSTRFGIRSIETRGGKLLLNGEPVRLAGANRVIDHPKFGATEPDELVRQDMKLMKDAHLELARLQHYPLAKNLLDWADENGILIIAEAANWGFPAEHMENPVIREKFKRQMREMVESSWNHPSVIGWSVGNEYESWTPAGFAWTKDMKTFVQSLDVSRPIGFVALGAACKRLTDDVKAGSFAKEQSSFHYSDILCPNVYATPAEAARWLDALHEQWPDKPILITEYGKRADQVKSEDERVAHFERMLKVVRERDYVCGLSYWAMADYRSRYPGTNPNGYRPWGIVDASRAPRPLYHAMRSALMPVVVSSVESRGDDPKRRLVVALAGRSDFPATRVRKARVRVISNRDNATIAEKPIDLIEPGAALTIELPLPPGAEPEPDLHVEVVSAADVVVGERTR